MDLSAVKGRNGRGWQAGKLATIVCFLAAGGILTTTLLKQSGIAGQIAQLFGPLF